MIMSVRNVVSLLKDVTDVTKLTFVNNFQLPADALRGTKFQRVWSCLCISARFSQKARKFIVVDLS